MQKFPLIAAAAGAIVAASALGAQAMPAAPLASDTPIINVAMGCGPGFIRGPYGGCRPMGYRRGPVVVVRPGYRRAWDGDRPHRRDWDGDRRRW
jgi:hypothetical protein